MVCDTFPFVPLSYLLPFSVRPVTYSASGFDANHSLILYYKNNNKKIYSLHFGRIVVNNNEELFPNIRSNP